MRGVPAAINRPDKGEYVLYFHTPLRHLQRDVREDQYILRSSYTLLEKLRDSTK
jgi:hypothetical protein